MKTSFSAALYSEGTEQDDIIDPKARAKIDILFSVLAMFRLLYNLNVCFQRQADTRQFSQVAGLLSSLETTPL